MSTTPLASVLYIALFLALIAAIMLMPFVIIAIIRRSKAIDDVKTALQIKIPYRVEIELAAHGRWVPRQLRDHARAWLTSREH